MKKYAISREFFPWNLFAPPISEKFLAMSVPHMKPPKSLWRDKALDVTTHDPGCHGAADCIHEADALNPNLEK